MNTHSTSGCNNGIHARLASVCFSSYYDHLQKISTHHNLIFLITPPPFLSSVKITLCNFIKGATNNSRSRRIIKISSLSFPPSFPFISSVGQSHPQRLFSTRINGSIYSWRETARTKYYSLHLGSYGPMWCPPCAWHPREKQPESVWVWVWRAGSKAFSWNPFREQSLVLPARRAPATPTQGLNIPLVYLYTCKICIYYIGNISIYYYR